MKKLFKRFSVLVLIACVIFAAGSVLVQLNDLDYFRRPIERLATSALGRNVQITGRIKLNILPQPEVILNHVSIANAEWGSQPIMVSLEHIDVSVNFRSFFSKTIVVKSLKLHDAAILMEHDEAHGSNWEMSKKLNLPSEKKVRPEHDKRLSLPIMVNRIDASNITLTLISPETPSQVYRLSSLSMQTDSSDNIILKSFGKFLDQAVNLDSKITSRKSLISGDQVTCNIRASLGDANLEGQLSVSRWEILSGLKGKLRLTVPDLANTLGVMQINAPLSGPLTADIDAVQSDNGTSVVAKAKMNGIKADATANLLGTEFRKVNLTLEVDDIQKTLAAAKFNHPFTGSLTVQAAIDISDSGYKAEIKASADRLTAALDGSYTDKEMKLNATLVPLKRVSELFNLKNINSDSLKLKASIKRAGAEVFEIKHFTADIDQNHITAQGRIDLNAASKLLVTLSSPDLKTIWEQFPSIGLNAKTSVQYSADEIALSNLSLTTDTSDLKGDVVWVKGTKKNITANLTSDTLDLRSFGNGSKDVDKALSEQKEAVPESQPKIDDRYIFKEKAVQLAPLKRIEADLKLAVKHLYHQAEELNNVVVHTTLHEGQAETKLKFDSAGHGHAAAVIDINSEEGQAAIAAVVSLSDFRLSVRDAGTVPTAEKPPINVSLELKSRGASPRALVSAASGRILLTQGSGKISNVDAKILTNDVVDQLFNALNPFAEKEEHTHLECSIIDIDLRDGQAKINNILVQSEKLIIIGGGDIDLKTETLNIEFNTIPRSGIGISADMFVTPFIFVSGTLKSPSIGLNKKSSLLKGSAAIATGGMTLFLQSIFDRATAQSDNCEKMKQQVGEHKPPPF